MDNAKVLRDEMQLVVQDAVQLYIDRKKRASGNWAKEVEIRLQESDTTAKASIYAYPYLMGRKAGKMPPVANIEEWIKAKNIHPVKDNMTRSALAWAIAKKIAREGTNKEYHLAVFDEVLTPERIDSIISKVAQLNVDYFLLEIEVAFVQLKKNI